MNDRLSPASDRNDEASSSSPSISLPFGIGPYGLPQGKTLLGSSPSAVAMFYPQISAYEIHPLIINQRRRSALDKSGLDSDLTGNSDDSVPLGLVTTQHSLGNSSTPLPLSLRHLYKDTSVAQKQRNVKRKVQVRDLDLSQDDCDDLFSGDLAGSSQQDSEASDYSSKARKSFFCRACGKSFKFQTSLLRHNNKVHISKYQCSTCNRVFSRQAYLDVHTSKQGSSCYVSPYAVSSSGKSQNSALSLSMGIKYSK